MVRDLSLDAERRFYAEEVCVVGNVQSPRLASAFASVRREDFLEPGPWDIGGADPRRPGGVTYRKTPDANPRHVYHNVLIAIDPMRELNNGHPSSLAAWLDRLTLGPGETFLHVGCGLGYYTAIAATVVGSSGRVIAVEIDAALAARAAHNLGAWLHVTVVSTDGAAYHPDACDAIFVNAGFTHPLPVWLDALKPGGRLLVPITAGMPGSPVGVGGMLLVTRAAVGFRAEFVSPVAIFSSPTGRAEDLNEPIRQAFGRGGWLRVKSVRVDAHAACQTCCIHGETNCLSFADLGTRPPSR